MRHSNKHHHKDRKTHKTLPSLAMPTASCSRQQRTAVCPAKYGPNGSQGESCSWGSAHSPPQHSRPSPAGRPHVPWQTTEPLARENTGYRYGCNRRYKAGSFVFKELLSFQLPSQPFRVAVRFGRAWRSREMARLRLFTLQLPAPRRRGKPCCSSPISFSLVLHHWRGIWDSSGQKHQWTNYQWRGTALMKGVRGGRGHDQRRGSEEQTSW